MTKGLSSVALGISQGLCANSCSGSDPVAMITGKVIRAECSFLSSSMPVSRGMELSVIKRS